jgi:hypothetical protein
LVLDKDRELGDAHAEIKALRLSERAREKAVEEVNGLTVLRICIQVLLLSLLFYFISKFVLESGVVSVYEKFRRLQRQI